MQLLFNAIDYPSRKVIAEKICNMHPEDASKHLKMTNLLVEKECKLTLLEQNFLATADLYH